MYRVRTVAQQTRSEVARYREGKAGGPIEVHTVATMPAGIGWVSVHVQRTKKTRYRAM